MKKILLGSIITLILIIPIASAVDISIEKKSEQPTPTMQDFTHTVFVEYGTMTTCGPCVTASAQLNSIYNSGDLDFYFVTLVWDEGKYNVRQRFLELGIVAVPDVFFDGGYKRVKGRQTSETPYRNAISESGEREVSDIDINMDVTWLGGGKLKIEATVINNEVEEFKGHIRTYIVEKESRWNDSGNHPYHFAALDIPIDKNLNVAKTLARPIGETYTFSKTWRGSLYGFKDIEQDNIMVIVAVFEKDTGNAVQVAAAEPTSKSGDYRQINPLFLRILERFPVLGKLLLLPIIN